MRAAAFIGPCKSLRHATLPNALHREPALNTPKYSSILVLLVKLATIALALGIHMDLWRVTYPNIGNWNETSSGAHWVLITEILEAFFFTVLCWILLLAASTAQENATKRYLFNMKSLSHCLRARAENPPTCHLLTLAAARATCAYKRRHRCRSRKMLGR